MLSKILLLYPFVKKVWTNIYKFLIHPLLTKPLLGLFWSHIIMQQYSQHLHNDRGCVDIDLYYFAVGTEAESSPFSSHETHQNNWQYPIILWSVYRRSDELPENESVIRKPWVWITDVMPAGQNVDKIGQCNWQSSEAMETGNCFHSLDLKCHIKI